MAPAVEYLLSHPEMSVSASVAAIALNPNYTALSISKMAKQFRLELQARVQ